MDRPEAFRGVRESAYAVDRFYTRATNDFDHSTTLRVTLPKEQLAKLEQYVRMGVVREYRSVQDIARDAIHHRLQWLADRFGDWQGSQMLSVQAGIALADQARASLAERIKFFEAHEAVLRDYEHGMFYELMSSYLDGLEMQEFDLDEKGAEQMRAMVAKWRDRCEAGLRRTREVGTT